MSNLIKVLSIDGGGVRGVIPAMILAEIEKRTQKSTSELFQLIAGTSTGGILALGLAKPDGNGEPEFSAQKMVNLYETEGKRIFSSSIFHRIRSVGSLVEEKYPSTGIEEVLNGYFKETRLKESLTDVIITSYEIERRIPWFFRSSRAKTDSAYDFPMRQVARATSAAPTYFEPLRIEVDGAVDYYALIDGGVFANNPAMCAYVEARSLYPDADDYLVVSLGTGRASRSIPYDRAKDWGLAGWAQPILSVVFAGVCETVDYQLRRLLSPREGSPRYYRFQTGLSEDNDDLDDASSANIRALKLMAQDLIGDNSDDLERLCEQLVQ